MPSLKRVETLVLLVPIGFLALYLIFYVAIACTIPVSWPYFIPSVQGATIKDPKQFFYPRANLTPNAVYPLADGVSLDMRVSCTQSNFVGEQECNFFSISLIHTTLSLQSLNKLSAFEARMVRSS